MQGYERQQAGEEVNPPPVPDQKLAVIKKLSKREKEKYAQEEDAAYRAEQQARAEAQKQTVIRSWGESKLAKTVRMSHSSCICKASMRSRGRAVYAPSKLGFHGLDVVLLQISRDLWVMLDGIPGLRFRLAGPLAPGGQIHRPGTVMGELASQEWKASSEVRPWGAEGISSPVQLSVFIL